MQLLIVGASARAAAQSAWRARMAPVAIDLFADRDLLAVGPARRIEARDYPGGIAALAHKLGPSPCMYTGALENHPGLIDRLARARPLWGIGGSALSAARDPLALAAVLRKAGLPALEVRASARGLPRDGSWLAKPLASAGGRGIEPLEPAWRRSGRDCYFQQYVRGTPLAAVFVATSATTRLLGVTYQWLGLPGAPFGYRGSIGPWPLGRAARERVALLGHAFGLAFGLRGLFGVDFVWCDGQPWVTEINPRYTASVEVLELALKRALLAEHRCAFDPEAPAPPAPPARAGRVVGKVVLFAEGPQVFPDRAIWRPQHEPFAVPRLADVPRPGTPFRAGQPVLTLMRSAATVSECRAHLTRALTAWKRRLRMAAMR